MRACRRLLAVLGVAWLTLLACSSGTDGAAGSCTSKGACPNDPPPTQSDIDQCNTDWNDPACGALFQTYFACAAQAEKCTTAGTVDDDATKAAIQSTCAAQVARYQACNSTPTCGAMGMPCCTGSTPCMGGCCDPSTQRCVGFLQPCSTPGQRCSASPSSCVACGSPGQPCCNGDCDQGCCISQGSDAGQGGDAGVCVAQGDSCTAFGGLSGICQFSAPRGFCVECGLPSSPCCKGGVCPNATTCTGTMCQ